MKQVKLSFKLILMAAFFYGSVTGAEVKEVSDPKTIQKTSQSSSEPKLLLARIEGTINPASSDYLKQSIHQATQMQAEIVLLELDTPGGLVQSVREMTQAIDESKVPVVVYVTPAGAAATSAGALLTIGSHYGVMAPGTNIGAAHPVSTQGKEVKGAAGEKAVQDVSAMARSLAKLRGKNVELAEKVVSESASFTAEEALENHLIDQIASTRSELLRQLHGKILKTKSGEQSIRTLGVIVTRSEMSLGQTLLHFLAHPNVAAILITLGMILIYMEISNPGLTIAGIAGALCLLIAFTAFQVLPMHTAGMVLLFLGLALMVAEPFIPSGGILAGGGVIAFVLGLLWAFDSEQSNLRVSDAVLIGSAIGLGFTALIVGWSAGRMKRLSRELFQRIGGGSKLGGLQGYEATLVSVGEKSHEGKAKVRGELWTVVSEDPLSVGDQVKVISIKGLKLKVVRIQSQKKD